MMSAQKEELVTLSKKHKPEVVEVIFLIGHSSMSTCWSFKWSPSSSLLCSAVCFSCQVWDGNAYDPKLLLHLRSYRTHRNRCSSTRSYISMEAAPCELVAVPNHLIFASNRCMFGYLAQQLMLDLYASSLDLPYDLMLTTYTESWYPCCGCLLIGLILIYSPEMIFLSIHLASPNFEEHTWDDVFVALPFRCSWTLLTFGCMKACHS